LKTVFIDHDAAQKQRQDEVCSTLRLFLNISCNHNQSHSLSALAGTHCTHFVTSFDKRSFSTAAPSVWNSLPTSVLNCDSLTLFKARLKTHLFSSVTVEYYIEKLQAVHLKL